MTRPIVGFLAEFTPVPHPADVGRPDPAAAEEAALREAKRIDALVAAAHDEGQADGRRAAEAEAAERNQQVAAVHAAELASARTDWLAAEGRVLADLLRSGLDTLEASLAESLVVAASPFIEGAVRARTLADLRQALADLMAGTQGAVFRIRGPEDLVAVLRAGWGQGPAAAFEVAETGGEEREVVVEAADTTIRSQMQAWTDRFAAAMRAPA